MSLQNRNKISIGEHMMRTNMFLTDIIHETQKILPALIKINRMKRERVQKIKDPQEWPDNPLEADRL